MSIVHLRVILTYLIPLLRVYINQHSSNALQFQLVQQCIQISTRINSSMYIVHTSFVFIRNSTPSTFRSAMVLLTNNSTGHSSEFKEDSEVVFFGLIYDNFIRVRYVAVFEDFNEIIHKIPYAD